MSPPPSFIGRAFHAAFRRVFESTPWARIGGGRHPRASRAHVGVFLAIALVANPLALRSADVDASSVLAAKRDLFALDREVLMDVRLTSAAGLTLAPLQTVPLSLTQTSARDLRDFGVSVRADLPAAGQAFTTRSYGYSHGVAEWAPFITKLSLAQELTTQWRGNASVVHYSGVPEAKDYVDSAGTMPRPRSAAALSDPGNNKRHGPRLFANLGFEYRPTNRWSLRFDVHNLVALADKKLSQRTYYFRLSEFNVQPASLILTARYGF